MAIVSADRQPRLPRAVHLALSQAAVVSGVAFGAIALSGCSTRHAPALIIAGAYFPGWMACAGLGILAAIILRAAMTATGLSNVLPFQLALTVAAGIVVSVAVWTIWYGT